MVSAMSIDVSNRFVFILEKNFRSIFFTENCVPSFVANQSESDDSVIQEHRARSIRTHDPGDGR